MKAIRVHEFGEPEVLKLEDVPDPTPGPNQVVVAVRAVGVNRSTSTSARQVRVQAAVALYAGHDV